MNAETHPFHPRDLDWLEPRGLHGSTLDAVRRVMWQNPAAAVKATGLARTVVSENGFVIACAGVAPTGEAWAFVSRHAKPYARVLVREARRALTEWAVPVYAQVNRTDEAAVRFAELVGFKFYEAGVWRYDPGPA